MRRWLSVLIAFLFMIFAGGETPAQIEPLPDEVQAPEETQAYYHLFDTAAYPTFNNIFILYVTDGVEAAWGAAGMGEFIESVIDSIPENTAMSFPLCGTISAMEIVTRRTVE